MLRAIFSLGTKITWDLFRYASGPFGAKINLTVTLRNSPLKNRLLSRQF
jgi:hypothetical protein